MTEHQQKPATKEDAQTSEEPEKTEGPHRVLMMDNAEISTTFQNQFCRLLEILECSRELVSTWQEARERLLSEPNFFQMVVLDPTVRDFKPQDFQKTVLREPAFRETKILLVRACPEDELYSFEDRLDVNGAVSRSQAPHELAFIIKRMLFDGAQQQRLHTRSLASVGVEFRSATTGTNQQHTCLNLSVAGMFLATHRPEKSDSRIALTLHIPDNLGPLRCLGRVVFSNSPQSADYNMVCPPGMGIYFEEISPSARTRIANFILPRLLRAERRATSRSMGF